MCMFFEKLSGVCHELLYYDKNLFKYLTNRNLSARTIERYKLGAFPKDLRVLLNKMHSDELIDNGIIWNASESKFKYDNIYYPVVIPIRDVNGRTIAVACRTLENDISRKELGIPKYKNSEYKKAHHLYGLDSAIDAIRKYDKVFVVEGYFDVISCHQSGIMNVVATGGTWLSKRQVALLSRYTENIVLLFDNDEPGRKSANKVINNLANSSFLKVNLMHKFTPNGYNDIDEYLCRGGELKFFND